MLKKVMGLLLSVCLLVGCSNTSPKSNEKVTIRIKCPPMTMAYDDEHLDTEIIDLFNEATEKFKKQYKDADVEFIIEKFQYVDEKKQVVDKIGTEEATDILFGGSFNIPGYILKNQLLALDDIIDDDLRNDIDASIWKQAQSDGKTYVMPYFTLQNNLLVNKEWMKKAKLDQYIPEDNQIAQWSIEEFNEILTQLKKVMTKDNEYPMFMYALNNQGDMHIMSLLMAYGAKIYDENGNYNINTKEGRKALAWLKELNQKNISPKGAENMEFMDNYNLFYNNQLVICAGNLVNIIDAKSTYGMDVFLANFPNIDGNGYATTYLNGFVVFDNHDENKAKVAKDFIKFIYSDKDLLKYGLSGIPVNKSYLLEHKDHINYLEAYNQNEKNVVDILNGTPNWEGIRSVFYKNMQSLLQDNLTVEEVAEKIDKECNAAIQKGREE